MLTLFSVPKPFAGHIGAIQRNAITSWTTLRPKPEIILFGNEKGVAQLAWELGLGHVPEVARNEFGTPLVSDVFAKAQQTASFEKICYVNADIILTRRFILAVELLHQECNRFTMFCTPWGLRLDRKLDFSAANWEEQLEKLAQAQGRPPKPVGVDLFLFPRGFYGRIPPLAIGRSAWDNWLVFKACLGRVPGVDATPFVRAVHQDHSGTTHGGTYELTEEHCINGRITGWWASSFVAADVPYVLEPDGQLRKKGPVERIRPRVRALVCAPPVIRVLNRTYALRRRIGLHRANGSQPASQP